MSADACVPAWLLVYSGQRPVGDGVPPDGQVTDRRRFGAPWSPKLVKVNADRPRGAVVNAPVSGAVPSCSAAYM